jgi:16S rRNA (cytidine1402-2'-O)-methyltransferase
MNYQKAEDVGKIILLNTPIGNLSDLTPRVQEALRVGEEFAVEDTRVFRELLNHLGITVSGKRIHSLHDQSETGQIQKLLELARSRDLYVASEAGSPIVSDPAYPLVLAAYENGIEVESFSGVSSPIMALELSGLPPIPFHFHGFLPRESSKRAKAFDETNYGTHIFFEAPTRIEETMDELAELHPEFSVAIVRELSKKFQQVVRLKAGDWESRKKEVTFKGEFILLLHRDNNTTQLMSGEVRELAEEILTKNSGPKNLAKLLGLILDRPTKDIYAELNQLKKS